MLTLKKLQLLKLPARRLQQPDLHQKQDGRIERCIPRFDDRVPIDERIDGICASEQDIPVNGFGYEEG